MVGTVTTYTAHAVRWKHGWELHVVGVGVTQVRTLAAAEQQVRDLVETMTDVDASDAEVEIVTDFAATGGRLQLAQQKALLAAGLQREAAAEIRTTAHELRHEGLSVTDISVVMKVSRGRVSQLLGEDDDRPDVAVVWPKAEVREAATEAFHVFVSHVADVAVHSRIAEAAQVGDVEVRQPGARRRGSVDA